VDVNKSSVDFIGCIIIVCKDEKDFPNTQIRSDFSSAGGNHLSAGNDHLSAGKNNLSAGSNRANAL
jgi:hypothetical protein